MPTLYSILGSHSQPRKNYHPESNISDHIFCTFSEPIQRSIYFFHHLATCFPHLSIVFKVYSCWYVWFCFIHFKRSFTFHLINSAFISSFSCGETFLGFFFYCKQRLYICPHVQIWECLQWRDRCHWRAVDGLQLFNWILQIVLQSVSP